MIRPELFIHEHLFATEKAAGLPLRLAYIGLWTQCDRDGRFEWRPLRLKLAILPWDEVDFAAVLTALAAGGFIERYEIDGKPYGCIPSWHKHQKPHHQEAKSAIPPSPEPSHDGAKGFGESPSGFVPSPEATRTISRRTQDGTKDEDGVETPLGEGQNEDLSPEWMAREFIHRYRGPIRIPQIDEVSKFFAGRAEATGDPKGIMDTIRDKQRDTTQTLLDFGNFLKARLKQDGKTNGKLSGEAMSEAVLAGIKGGQQ